MSRKKQTTPTYSEFFPENVEFLSFIGGWDCHIGIDTVQQLFYLIRTNDLDWLEIVVKNPNAVMSRNCVMSIPRYKSTRGAAARLLETHIRTRTQPYFPISPYRSGLLTSGELENIVESAATSKTAKLRN